MRVVIADLREFQAGVRDGLAEGARALDALGVGGGQVVGIAGGAVARGEGVDARPPGYGAVVVLEDEDARALADEEAVPVLVEGARGFGRIVIPAGGQGFQPAEAAHET